MRRIFAYLFIFLSISVNSYYQAYYTDQVVFDTTKIEIFKQITTGIDEPIKTTQLCLIPQR
ncbi:hypothetical protein HMPREF0648_0524 [Prevotella bivia JCVIHMP010]|nr:hypothetical protein HMPREF0648_0524 [Prevotella bivia JCVIHMP010]